MKMVRVVSLFQPEQLIKAIDKAGLTHGVEADVHIFGAAIEHASVVAQPELVPAGENGSKNIFWCPVNDFGGIQVNKTITKGDGGSMADEVFVGDTLALAAQRLPLGRLFEIEHALISSNGRTVISAKPGVTRLVLLTDDGQRTEEEAILV